MQGLGSTQSPERKGRLYNVGLKENVDREVLELRECIDMVKAADWTCQRQ